MSVADPNPVLPLDPSARSLVFRAVEAALRADAVLDNVVDLWQSWEGNPSDKAEAPRAKRLVLSLAPADGSTAWYSPDSQVEGFVVDVVLDIESLCIDDALNAWAAVERALLPADPTARESIRQALVAAGARDGMPEFMPPAFLARPSAGSGGRFAAHGQIKLEIDLFYNP